MLQKAKISLLFIAAMIMGVVVISCDNADSDPVALNETEELQDGPQQMKTRNVGVKTPKLTVYIETNDINPLNAKEYRFCNSTEEVVDHVILFASNIRGTCTTVQLYHNPNQTYILNNRATLIAPLQTKGIKVLLGILGDHTGVGFANLTPTMLESFAQQIAACVNNNNLDGVDFDDEYAKYYQAPAGLPSPSATIYGNLIKRVKQLLPGKLVTAFCYGNAFGFDQATLNALDYMWPDFGCNSTPPTGLPNSKWAKLSLKIIGNGPSYYPDCRNIQTCTSNYTGYGAIMFFNLRQWDASSIMNCFASNVWGRSVCWTGVSHVKNYPPANNGQNAD